MRHGGNGALRHWALGDGLGIGALGHWAFLLHFLLDVRVEVHVEKVVQRLADVRDDARYHVAADGDAHLSK